MWILAAVPVVQLPQPSVMDWLMPLLQFGGVGVCLIWFMFRSEPRLRAIEAAIDRAARAMIVLSIAIADMLGSKAIKLQAEPIQKELDDVIERRTK